MRFVGDVRSPSWSPAPTWPKVGADLVGVDYEPLPAVLDAEKALAADAPVLDEELGHGSSSTEDSAGDVEQAFADAAHVFAKRFRVSRSAVAPLEPWHHGRLRRRVGPADGVIARQLPHLLRTFWHRPSACPRNLKLTVIAGPRRRLRHQGAHQLPGRGDHPGAEPAAHRPVKWIEDRYESPGRQRPLRS
ncbi:hypothetical protein HBB16_19725 [Pseudonocardia sp. MCCB 268]|nr:hypothetical protein [Pseudonocardia cytotoxica]